MVNYSILFPRRLIIYNNFTFFKDVFYQFIPKRLPHFREDMVWECNGRETEFLCNCVPKQMLQQVHYTYKEFQSF
jgi:hypothetical protein